MEITVIPSVNEARSKDFVNKTVIVIDVLRATSTIVTAFAHGCEAVYPVETVKQTRELHEPGWLLGGERSCKRIPGFDFGNSPFEYMDDRTAGKTILITTTNGTRAIQKASKASTILAASLLNGSACAREAAFLKKDIVILCSGTQDVFAFEDGICAGQLVEELQRILSEEGIAARLDDFGLSMLYAFRQAQPAMTEALLNCANGLRLTQLGFIEDIIYCSRMNIIQLVPVMSESKLVVSSVNSF